MRNRGAIKQSSMWLVLAVLDIVTFLAALVIIISGGHTLFIKVGTDEYFKMGMAGFQVIFGMILLLFCFSVKFESDDSHLVSTTKGRGLCFVFISLTFLVTGVRE